MNPGDAGYATQRNSKFLANLDLAFVWSSDPLVAHWAGSRPTPSRSHVSDIEAAAADVLAFKPLCCIASWPKPLSVSCGARVR